MMHMVQQSVSINGRAVMVLEAGKLYRVESTVRQKARMAGRRLQSYNNVFHVVRASCCREAIEFADDPKVPKLTGNDMETANDDAAENAA